MKILFVNNLLGYYGGVEQVVQDYAVGLRERGHDCSLVYGVKARDAESYGQAFTSVHSCIDLNENGNGSVFKEIVKAIEPDVIFVHKVNHLPRDFDSLKGVRAVRMVHDHDLWCPKGTGYYTRNRKTCQVSAGWPCYLDGAFLERSKTGLLPVKFRSVSQALNEMKRNYAFDSILVLSEYLQQRLVRNGFPADRIHINNPVVKQEVLDCQPVPAEPRVLFVGSLIRGKGVDFLLRALALVTRFLTLDIVGAGSEERNLKRLADELGISNRVNFLGWVPHSDLPNHYQSARLVAVPSCWPEPFGLIGQEAMRYARPVVAFKVGGIPDWCDHGKTGLLVDEQDVEGFALAIEKLLTDDALANSMGMNGLRKAREIYSMERGLDRLEGLLRGH